MSCLHGKCISLLHCCHLSLKTRPKSLREFGHLNYTISLPDCTVVARSCGRLLVRPLCYDTFYEVIGYTAAVYAMSDVAYTAAVYATPDIAYTAAILYTNVAI